MNRPVLAVAVLSLVSRTAQAEDTCRDAAPWNHLGSSLQNLAEPRPLVLAGLAPITAGLLIPTGLDHRLRVYSQTDLGGHYYYEPVSVPAPYVLFGALLVGYGGSVALSACEWQRPQAAMLQAMALTAMTVSLLKISVGREWPNAGRDPASPDRLEHPEFATDFTPFQRFGAWPSGHTASMFAAASALRGSARSLGWPAWLGYPFAVGVGLGMAMNDRHWVADIVAGALLGEAVGSSVGQSFFATGASSVNVGVLPAGAGGVLFSAVGTW